MISLNNAGRFQHLNVIEQFNDDDKTIVKKLIDAFIVKKQLQLMAFQLPLMHKNSTARQCRGCTVFISPLF